MSRQIGASNKLVPIDLLSQVPGDGVGFIAGRCIRPTDEASHYPVFCFWTVADPDQPGRGAKRERAKAKRAARNLHTQRKRAAS